MQERSMTRRQVLALGAGAVASWTTRSALASDFVVAVSPRVRVKRVSRSKLRRALTGRLQRWPGGDRVRIVLPPKGSPSMKWLCREVLRVPESRYRRFLMEKAFRGDIDRPLQAASEREASELILEQKGAIGPLPRRLAEDLQRPYP